MDQPDKQNLGITVQDNGRTPPKVIRRSPGMPLPSQVQSAWALEHGCLHLSYKGEGGMPGRVQMWYHSL